MLGSERSQRTLTESVTIVFLPSRRSRLPEQALSGNAQCFCKEGDAYAVRPATLRHEST